MPQCIIRAVPKTPEAATTHGGFLASAAARPGTLPVRSVFSEHAAGNDGCLSKYLVFALNQHSSTRRSSCLRETWYLLVGIMRTEGFIRNILHVPVLCKRLTDRRCATRRRNPSKR
uniref:Uncharacterized protein n=1 Tax=Anopheles maculatus TaxID=74869 RepID=A0A182T7A0_9DIPT